MRSCDTVTALCKFTAHGNFMPSSSFRTTSDGTPRIVATTGATVTVDKYAMALLRVSTRAGRFFRACQTGRAELHPALFFLWLVFLQLFLRPRGLPFPTLRFCVGPRLSRVALRSRYSLARSSNRRRCSRRASRTKAERFRLLRLAAWSAAFSSFLSSTICTISILWSMLQSIFHIQDISNLAYPKPTINRAPRIAEQHPPPNAYNSY